jgi:uncharacterized membrane protein
MPLLSNAAPNAQDAVSVTSWNTVASFAQYNDARDAIDQLARQDFPVDELEIVGSDLRTVERVTGKITTERAALSGAAAGASVGLFVGLLVGLFTTGPAWLGLVLGGLLIGAAWGATFGFVARHLVGGHHDFSSLNTIAATRYDIIALDGLAAQARTALL